MDVDRSLRSFYSGKRDSYPFTSLNHTHICDAIEHSLDNGVTLTFSKLGLSDVGARSAEELAGIERETSEESAVKRIALGNNHLTTLPAEFALLSNLRYLNLKHNNFSVFPAVLTLMPSLDTLDISHNKIKRLPSQPGQLVQLRVFSLSRNKIARLPPYLSQFYNLDVLQVDRNPIEWPPSSVVDLISTSDSTQHKEWIRSLQQWLEADSFQEHPINDQDHNDSELENYTDPWGNDTRNPPHSRSFSADSSLSAFSVTESLQENTATSSLKNSAERPPPLHLGILKSYSAEASPTRSFESYLPSPAGSDISFQDTACINPFQVDYHEPRLHARNESYNGGLRNTNRVELHGKKSMPDLRTAKLNFEELSSNFAEEQIPTDLMERDQNSDEFVIPSDPLDQQDSHSSNGSDFVQSRSVTRGGARFGTSVAFELHAYFRGLSTPPSTAPLPKAAVSLIDSARSILFAISQVHETLEHYAVNAADGRLPSILKKVLDPTSADITHLINALVRFDVTSRKGVPSPGVCRDVVQNCKNSVAVFGKAVAVLSLQLKVITTGHDVRHSRRILLELNAALVEISCAWQAIIPHMDAIKTLLRVKAFTAQSPPLNAAISNAHAVKGVAKQPSPILRPPPAGLISIDVSANAGRVRTARRHAGSFSSKDVEIGKKLPSYDDIPGTLRGVVPGLATHTPTLRPLKRQVAVPPPMASVTISSSSPANPVSLVSTSSTLPEEAFRTNHSRQTSQGSLQTSASPSAPSKPGFLDLPFNSKSQVDKDALQAVQAAVDIAPEVWDMIEDTLGGAAEATETVRETLETARAVTARLSDLIRSMQSVDSGPSDRKSLREDAHIFLKTVVQLSNIIKAHGAPQTVSSALRTKMVKLTNSTEEFAILLHVSSLSPTIPRPYSPMLSTLSPDENRLGFSLSRSQSAQPSATFKLPLQSRDGPRSALPTQSFQIPVARGPRSRETYNDLVDPG